MNKEEKYPDAKKAQADFFSEKWASYCRSTYVTNYSSWWNNGYHTCRDNWNC